MPAIPPSREVVQHAERVEIHHETVTRREYRTRVTLLVLTILGLAAIWAAFGMLVLRIVGRA